MPGPLEYVLAHKPSSMGVMGEPHVWKSCVMANPLESQEISGLPGTPTYPFLWVARPTSMTCHPCSRLIAPITSDTSLQRLWYALKKNDQLTNDESSATFYEEKCIVTKASLEISRLICEMFWGVPFVCNTLNILSVHLFFVGRYLAKAGALDREIAKCNECQPFIS